MYINILESPYNSVTSGTISNVKSNTITLKAIPIENSVNHFLFFPKIAKTAPTKKNSPAIKVAIKAIQLPPTLKLLLHKNLSC